MEIKKLLSITLVGGVLALTGCAPSENKVAYDVDMGMVPSDVVESIVSEPTEWVQETINAEEYFENNTQELEIISAEDATLLTESEIIDLMNEIGVYSMYQEIGYYYNADGSDTRGIASVDSTDVHPSYVAYYSTLPELTDENALDVPIWGIYYINDTLMAIPINYIEWAVNNDIELTEETYTEIIFSDSDYAMSYDNVTNTYFRSIPLESAAMVVNIGTVDAETLNSISFDDITNYMLGE